MKKKLNRHRIHLLVGVFFFPFLLISALTGFFRANHHWFWKEDYKKVKNTTYAYTLDKPAIGIDSIFSIASLHHGAPAPLSEIRLRKEAGMLFYDARAKGLPPLLIDATTGKVMSPLSESLAITLAGQYVKSGTEVKRAYPDEQYRTRKEKKPRAVYVIEYADALHTMILLDKNNGEIEEEIDNNLKFGFWMVKLHDYDFWNSKRLLLSIVGAGLTVVGLTGFYLWLRKKDKKKKRKASRPETTMARL